MTNFAITAQYPVFTELDGTPLENGFIYIGQPNVNPITNPLTAYWDDGLLYPAGQPIRTLAGAPNRNGSPSPIYVAGEFSILVRDKNGEQIYYGATGIKNYTSTLTPGYNYAQNPGFEVFQRLSSADRWIADVSGYTLNDSALVVIEFDQNDIPGKPRYWKKLSLSGGSALASEFARYVQVIEDVYKFSGETVNFSFWAKVDSGLTRIATSFDQCSAYDPATQINQGIAPTIHNLTADARQYNVTVTLPGLLGGGAESILDTRDTGLQLNIWLAAGSDYDDQTQGLGDAAGDLYITDVRLTPGSQIDTSPAREYSQELLLCERYFEKSGVDLFGPGNDDDEGSIVYIASETSTTLPGFRYRTRKRLDTPAVTVYSPNADDQSDFVFRIGTGQVAVSQYNWINDTGISTMTLGAAKVAGDLYQYHYAVDAEFIL